MLRIVYANLTKTNQTTNIYKNICIFALSRKRQTYRKVFSQSSSEDVEVFKGIGQRTTLLPRIGVYAVQYVHTLYPYLV